MQSFDYYDPTSSMNQPISMSFLQGCNREFQRFQDEFVSKLKPHIESFSLIVAHFVYEDTFHVLIEKQRGGYEVWSYSPNRSDIMILASWERLED